MADGTAESRPFGLEISQAVCDRATRLAKTMFCALEAQIIFLRDGEVWRSRDPDSKIVRQRDKAAELVQASGELLWIEDAHLDPRFADSPSDVGPPYLRSYVGVPIRLADGSTPTQNTRQLPHPTSTLIFCVTMSSEISRSFVSCATWRSTPRTARSRRRSGCSTSSV